VHYIQANAGIIFVVSCMLVCLLNLHCMLLWLVRPPKI